MRTALQHPSLLVYALAPHHLALDTHPQCYFTRSLDSILLRGLFALSICCCPMYPYSHHLRPPSMRIASRLPTISIQA
ncbi:hypothetical protein CBOM_07511 [Ceraceosorus bombacis]|uniref:Uncharacterized protein n=1 Tax=Ceraceosorus bombacis TaxID=401625 RepID=A0A0P1BDR7_9BASI|nr:hypothetical protein CBOM_07511 [Ceraceosorus bombacis]